MYEPAFEDYYESSIMFGPREVRLAGDSLSSRHGSSSSTTTFLCRLFLSAIVHRLIVRVHRSICSQSSSHPISLLFVLFHLSVGQNKPQIRFEASSNSDFCSLRPSLILSIPLPLPPPSNQQPTTPFSHPPPVLLPSSPSSSWMLQ